MQQTEINGCLEMHIMLSLVLLFIGYWISMEGLLHVLLNCHSLVWKTSLSFHIMKLMRGGTESTPYLLLFLIFGGNLCHVPSDKMITFMALSLTLWNLKLFFMQEIFYCLFQNLNLPFLYQWTQVGSQVSLKQLSKIWVHQHLQEQLSFIEGVSFQVFTLCQIP